MGFKVLSGLWNPAHRSFCHVRKWGSVSWLCLWYRPTVHCTFPSLSTIVVLWLSVSFLHQWPLHAPLTLTIAYTFHVWGMPAYSHAIRTCMSPILCTVWQSGFVQLAYVCPFLTVQVEDGCKGCAFSSYSELWQALRWNLSAKNAFSSLTLTSCTIVIALMATCVER